jgi:hypothetical protein
MPQLLHLSRNRRTEVEELDETTIRSSCRIQDNVTDAFVEIIARLPDLEITEVKAHVNRSPREECMGTVVDGMQKALGIRIGAGMTEIIKGTLSDCVECEELIFMLEECCHGVILSLTRDVLEKAPADRDGKHAFFSNMVKKNIRLYNRCAAFAPGSSLVDGLSPPE